MSRGKLPNIKVFNADSLTRLKPEYFTLAEALAQNFKPVTGRDLEELLAKTAEPGRDGKLEVHKTTRYGSANHFRQHGE